MARKCSSFLYFLSKQCKFWDKTMQVIKLCRRLCFYMWYGRLYHWYFSYWEILNSSTIHLKVYRSGLVASAGLIVLCNLGVLHGFISWHNNHMTLQSIAYHNVPCNHSQHMLYINFVKWRLIWAFAWNNKESYPWKWAKLTISKCRVRLVAIIQCDEGRSDR